MELCWRWHRWDTLDRDDLYALMRLRQDVFVVEQDCAYADVDGRDPDAWHLLGEHDGALIAYLRVFEPVPDDPRAHIGRVVVHERARGRGVGYALMREGAAQIERILGPVNIHLSAQAHLEGFYGTLGYVTVGPGYDEDGIPHLPMDRHSGG